MSEMEFHTGTAKEVAVDITGFAAKVAYIRDELDAEIEEVDEDGEYLYAEGFHFIEGKMYQVDDEERDIYEFLDATLNPDGSFSYRLYYHNGGASFGEALDIAISKARGQS